MKIAVIRSECSFSKGGAERYAANLCRCLLDLGHQVWVLAEKFDPRIHPDLVHIPIKVNRATSWTRNRSFHENSQKALRELRVDAVLALSRSFPSDAFRVSDPLHRFWMKIRYPGKLHRFLQSLNPRHREILRLEAGILDPANTRMILTNSELSKAIIREYYDYPAERIHVVYNGVDLERFSPDSAWQPDPSGVIRLLFVGQDFKRKGLSGVIQALAHVRAAGFSCHLRVIGRDNPLPYQKKAKEHGVSDHTTFEGSSGKIYKAYRQADLLVFPSLYDPFANVCLEALACGLPVLTTTTNGSSEILTEGSDGYVVEGQGASLSSHLAEKITAFCRLSPEQRADMRRRARAKAEKFTVRANASSIVGLLAGKGGVP